MSLLVRLDRRAARATSRDERGFTLVELLIVMVLIPIIVGALALSLVSVFSLQSSVSNRLGDSGNSQVVVASYTKDVQMASMITTSASPAVTQCGPGTQVLGLQLGTGEYVSYNEVAQSTGALYSLARDECSSAATLSAPSTSQTLAYDLEPPCSITDSSGCQSLPVTTRANAVISTASWVSTIGVTSVVFTLSAPKSAFVYTVAAEPLGADSTNPNQLGVVGSGDTCDFAQPGTGTYASQLCFFDFSKYFTGGVMPSNLPITEYVPGGYELTADLTVTGGNTVGAHVFPTYQDAFLGNISNGKPFYTGVGQPPGYQGTTSKSLPAIYQFSSGATNTVSLSNINLTTSSGAPVSGYEIVTADAETTDPGEYISWSSNLSFNQIPNNPGDPTNPSSLEGNACSTLNNDGSTNYGGGITDANGNPLSAPISNAPTVKCISTIQASTPRTGTLMLEVSPPASGTGANGSTSIQATMHGAGLEGVTFGLLLP